MEDEMNRKSQVVIAGLFLFAYVCICWASITGRVVDGAGNPVADAMITYTNIDNRLIYSYTCSDGRFVIPGPSEWDMKNLKMYDCSTDILPNTKVDKNKSNAPDLVVVGTRIQFHVNAQQHVTINLLTLNGRRIQTVFDENLAPGNYRFSPLTLVANRLSRQVCIVRVTCGTVSQSKAIAYCDEIKGGSFVANDNAVSSGAGLPKLLASVDTLRAGKTGFTANLKPIDNYSSNIGDITIQTRDIEAEITTLMNGKTASWKARQVTQAVQYSTADTWGTIFFGVGNGGPTTTANADITDTWQTGTINSEGTPKLVAIDAVHGFISPPGGTFFPHNIGMGCTGNPLLAELEERITAIELRGMGINWAFAPCIDVPRNVRWGRTYEGWDESPSGTVPFAKGAIRGFQGTDLSASCVVAATAKHFVGSGGTTDGINAGNCATGTNDVLAKIHMPPFKTAVDNGAATVMASMCQWLGTSMHFNKTLLTDTLKTAWKFDGFVVGDWGSSSSDLIGSFNDGVDNMMTPTTSDATYGVVVAAPAARLDDACRRILRVKLRLNLMQNSKANRAYLPLIKCSLHNQVARECVRRSVVLLKNDAVNGAKPLPINVNSNVHIVGSFADDMYMQIGGWCLDWPSAWYDTPKPVPPAGTTLKAAIQAACKGTVTYSATSANIPATANVIVVCVGELPYAETGGDAPLSQPITLTQAHKDLISQCAASGKPVVVVLYSGRPLIIADDIAKVPAWLAAFLPGTEGGGIADILFSVNGEKPTAKLSHSWPKTVDQLPLNANSPSGAPYGDAVGSGGDPLFPYHFGLTY